MDIELVTATAADAATLQNLMQLYIHDFTEQWAGEARGELGPDGLFPPPFPLDRYWTEANWRAWLFKRGGAPVGFALVNDEPHSSLPADHSMAEFFVVRKHRRGGLGRAAAQRLFRELPGQWDVAIARKNVGALKFWREAIASLPGVRNIAELDMDDETWNGPIIRFRSG